MAIKAYKDKLVVLKKELKDLCPYIPIDEKAMEKYRDKVKAIVKLEDEIDVLEGKRPRYEEIEATYSELLFSRFPWMQ